MDNALHAICLDAAGKPKPKNECRADLINHLILEQGVDIDEAEDIAEKTMQEAGYWNEAPAAPPQE